ncbi:MAG: hypothetical protein GY718_06265 [Lentisphaerae bacterium]|nr:hypothetical protein [Lentisphaerota bacterium]
MERQLIIFGNGLGMAIDPDHFKLENAIARVWENNNILSNDDKKLIRSCLSKKTQGFPKSENELDILHLATTACETLLSIKQNKNNHWLSEQGRSFPKKIKSFIYGVASDLYTCDRTLPNNFVDELANFIKGTNSHIATLNYDKLLYDGFLEKDLMQGYSGYLIDGILDKGFSPSNLDSYSNHSYYFHLHGSPLFYEENKGIICKYKRHKDLRIFPKANNHIVLSHIKHKTNIIANSVILQEYWNRLPVMISEVQKIVLFGYSGLDAHLNDLLKLYASEKTFRIIEWSGEGDITEREQFWKRKLGNEIQVEHLDIITDFTDWT